ncbi:MAG: DNA recombination protein RmuC [Chthoniobacterales bacterium]
MSSLLLTILLVIALVAVGVLSALLFFQRRLFSADKQQLEKHFEEKITLLNEARQHLANEFKALSLEALTNNNRAFIDLAKADLEKRQDSIEAAVKPVRESLEKFRGTIQSMEKEREGAYRELRTQVVGMQQMQASLTQETSNLVRALRAPQARGRWGEIQLRRVVELAGMQDHCDFDEQVSVRSDDRNLRPDMAIRLPGGKTVVVDSKVALDAYLSALESPDEATRLICIKRHAEQVKTHISQLSRKAYWEQFDNAPEFVVLFLPMESVFGAALEQEPTLIEDAARNRVILATPTTLIALLRAVYYGWQQETVTENARKISDLGQELYKRLATFGEHMQKAGAGLQTAVRSYNQAVGSLEGSVLPQARRFTELGVGSSSKEIPDLAPLDTIPRQMEAPEFQALLDPPK